MSEKFLGDLVDIANEFPASSIEQICQNLLQMEKELDANESFARLEVSRYPNLNHRMKSLFQAWKRDLPELSPPSMAWSLRAAITSGKKWRENSRSDLVWTGPTEKPVLLRRTQQALVDTIDAAEKQLWFVSYVAYGVPEIRAAMKSAVERRVTVNFVSESAEESGEEISHDLNLSLGTDLKEQLKVFVWPKEKRETNNEGNSGVLHVKCALADNRKLLIGSANLTGRAMNLNMELGVLLEGGELPNKLKAHLDWMVSSKILVQV